MYCQNCGKVVSSQDNYCSVCGKLIQPSLGNGNNKKETDLKLIPIKCPNCGGPLEIREDQKKAKCRHCDCDIVIHDPTKIEIDISTDSTSRNFVQIGLLAEQNQNLQEALSYFIRAIELDGKNPEAWLGKARIIIVLADSANIQKIQEARTYVTKAIEYGINPANCPNLEKTIEIIANTYFHFVTNKFKSIESAYTEREGCCLFTILVIPSLFAATYNNQSKQQLHESFVNKDLKEIFEWINWFWKYCTNENVAITILMILQAVVEFYNSLFSEINSTYIKSIQGQINDFRKEIFEKYPNLQTKTKIVT